MRIKIHEVRALCDQLMSHLENTRGELIEIDMDYYWDISDDKKYNMSQEPVEHVVGQLTDDWRELKSILDGTMEPIDYHFVWLAAILRSVGECMK